MPLEEDHWLNLPSNILDIILSKIPLFYHPKFASVCKNWNAIFPHKLYPVDQADPLLIHVKNWKSGFIYYYSPVWNKTFKVRSPIALQESCLFSSKNGWLVLYRKVLEDKEEVEVVLINPTTNISYSYPGLQRDHALTGITFSGHPGTEDFILFCISSLEWRDDVVRICLWKEGEWKINRIYDNQSPFSMSADSSPVEFKDSFYCVSESGRLGVFILENESWNILPEPKRFSTPIFSKEMYLIESKDRIRLVVGGNHDPQVSQVFYLDCKKLLWRKIKNLGNRSIFVGPKASIMINFDKEDEGNKTAYENVHDNRKLEDNEKKEVDNEVHDVENLKGGEEVDVVKKADWKKKSNEVEEEVGKKEETQKKKDNYKEKVDVDGNLMNNRVYGSGFYGNVEVLEAEMKISDGELFFVLKACDHRRGKDMPTKGTVVSYSLENLKITGKNYGLSYPLHCAWYRPEISFGLQVQEIEK